MQHRSLKNEEGNGDWAFHSYFKTAFQVLLQSTSAVAGSPFSTSPYDEMVKSMVLMVLTFSLIEISTASETIIPVDMILTTSFKFPKIR